jgi:DNA recombination protein RmuC
MSTLEMVVVALCLVSLVSLGLQVLALRRKERVDLGEPGGVPAAMQALSGGSERIERALRDEIARSREEAQATSRHIREELAGQLKATTDTLNLLLAGASQASESKHEKLREIIERQLQQSTQDNAHKLEQARQATQLLQETIGKRLDMMRQESCDSVVKVRDEVTTALKAFDESVISRILELGAAQKNQLELVMQGAATLADSNDKRFEALRISVDGGLKAIQDDSSKKLEALRAESSSASKQTREEVSTSLKAFNDSVLMQMTALGDTQRKAMSDFAAQIDKLTTSNQQKLDELKASIDLRLHAIQEQSSTKLELMRNETGAAGKQTRDEVSQSLKAFNDSVLAQMTGLGELQRKVMSDFADKLEKLTASNQQKLDELKGTVDMRLKGMQEDNAKQLEQVRITVDEKLQGTLEKRLGDSFKQVSERLEQVYKGLGEMQVLATGVGDLKKVLSNVKTRGTWGEVQLGALLEQVLSPAQYSANVSPKNNSERVEFAVRMPARGGELDEIVWLPIDAKFPIEDYQRLVEAQESADTTGIDAAASLLDLRIRQCAKDIAEKYISPPQTTDFGILFLPTEGLFAEVVRRPGLCEVIQQKYRVVIAGPTTLWSILTSLQMGFRTLAIQKRSSEVWNLLAAVKSEWTKYGEVLDKVNKKLQEATNTMDQAAVRTRAIGRKLRAVEELPAAEAELVLALETGDASDTTEESVST